MSENKWPKDEFDSLNAFYGKHKYDDEGTVLDRWESQFLTRFKPPFQMKLSWDVETPVRLITCNKACFRSLACVLQKVWEAYGMDQDAINRDRLNLYGGCYNFRRARGLGRLSAHAWGAAIDLDPDKNSLGQKWAKGKGMMPEVVIDIFKAEGWVWGGDFKSRPDCMHFQAATI